MRAVGIYTREEVEIAATVTHLDARGTPGGCGQARSDLVDAIALGLFYVASTLGTMVIIRCPVEAPSLATRIISSLMVDVARVKRAAPGGRGDEDARAARGGIGAVEGVTWMACSRRWRAEWR